MYCAAKYLSPEETAVGGRTHESLSSFTERMSPLGRRMRTLCPGWMIVCCDEPALVEAPSPTSMSFVSVVRGGGRVYYGESGETKL